MQIKVGEYLVTSDSMQFIVNKIGTVQESRLTNAENVGKETSKVIAYCTKFEEVLKYIPNDTIKSNDDINIIVDKLNSIQGDIQALKEYPVIFIKEDDEITIKKETYEQLKINEGKMKALKDGGVEQWEGFDDAIINYYKKEKKSEIDIEEIEKEEVEE